MYMYIIKLLKKNMKNYRLELYTCTCIIINANNAQSNNFEIPESTPSKVRRLSLGASISLFTFILVGIGDLSNVNVSYVCMYVDRHMSYLTFNVSIIIIIFKIIQHLGMHMVYKATSLTVRSYKPLSNIIVYVDVNAYERVYAHIRSVNNR